MLSSSAKSLKRNRIMRQRRVEEAEIDLEGTARVLRFEGLGGEDSLGQIPKFEDESSAGGIGQSHDLGILVDSAGSEDLNEVKVWDCFEVFFLLGHCDCDRATSTMKVKNEGTL